VTNPGQSDRSFFSYNAVNLSAGDVARTFVDPVAYGQLVAADNAILVGPRGAGKTTLLKMLQSEALEVWDGESADMFASYVKSSGVFIGADRLWAEQLDATAEPIRVALSNAAYAFHVARSLSRVMQFRLHGPREGSLRAHLRVNMSSELEAQAAAALSRYFSLGGSPRDMTGVSRLVQRRLVDLGGLRHAARFDDVDIPAWVHIDALTAAEAAVTEFNALAGESEHRWTLLFDELELAPSELVRELLSRLRGGMSPINYKLSLAPVLEHAKLLGGAVGAVDGQDMDVIALSGTRREDATLFTGRLFEQYFSRQTPGGTVGLQKLFGDSLTDGREAVTTDDSGDGKLSSVYSAKGPVGKAMAELRAKDVSFKKYLDRNRIDLAHIDELAGSSRAAKVRKMRNLVVTRNYFRGSDSMRSRKSAELYSGYDALTVFPDGNPRMTLSLLRELHIRLAQNLDERVSPSQQGQAILAVQERFVALLSAQESAVVRGQPMTVLELLDLIGGRLASRILEEEFSPDAPAGFSVGRNLPGGIILLLERAFNAGALIPVDGLDKNRVLDGVVDRKFRLSYLLAPRYKLPMRMGKAVSLASLLRNVAPTSSPLFDLDS